MSTVRTLGTHSLLLVFALALGTGCGTGPREDQWTKGRPPVHPVSGQLLHDGSPVADATITFQPVDAAGKPGYAMTDSRGYFKAQTFNPADGLTAGAHRVAVQKTQILDRDGNILKEVREPEGVVEKHLLPERYADFQKSDLEITVTADQSNDLGELILTN